MNLKYYLRGLGMGVIVTAGVLSFSGKTEELTDAEIKMRAVKLGMVEKSVLADIQNDKSNVENVVKNDEEKQLIVNDNINIEKTTDGQIGSETENKEDETGNEQSEKQNKAEAEQIAQINEKQTEVVQEQNKDKKDTTKKDSIEKKDEKVEKYVIISVEPGNGSELISRKLYEAGLVDSAIMFNRFLVANEYAKILRSGDHEIPVGASEEEMARILCGLE